MPAYAATETGRRGGSDARGPDGGGEHAEVRLCAVRWPTVGVSKSVVSRETVEASERVGADGAGCVGPLATSGPMGSPTSLLRRDSDGKKHVLGVREGASENAEVTRRS